MHRMAPPQVRLPDGEHVTVQFAGDLVESLRRFHAKHPDKVLLLGTVVWDFDAVPSHLLDALREQVGMLFPGGASLGLAFDLLHNFVDEQGQIVDPRERATQTS